MARTRRRVSNRPSFLTGTILTWGDSEAVTRGVGTSEGSSTRCQSSMTPSSGTQVRSATCRTSSCSVGVGALSHGATDVLAQVLQGAVLALAIRAVVTTKVLARRHVLG